MGVGVGMRTKGYVTVPGHKGQWRINMAEQKGLQFADSQGDKNQRWRGRGSVPEENLSGAHAASLPLWRDSVWDPGT